MSRILHTSDSFAELLREVLRPDPAWQKDDLHAILAHLMQLPLGWCVSESGLSGQERSLTLRQAINSGSCQVLERVKVFAKTCRTKPDETLPDPVAAAIYFAAIAAATVRYAVRISALDGKSLSEGMSWLAEQDWADEELRMLLSDAARTIVMERAESS